MTQILIFADDSLDDVETTVLGLGFELRGNVYCFKDEDHIRLQLDYKPHERNVHWAEFARSTSKTKLLFMDYHLDADGNETDDLCPMGKRVYGSVLGGLARAVKYNTLGHQLK